MTSDRGERVAHVYELRTFVAKEDRLAELVELWESAFYGIFARSHDVVGAFVAHPERSAMPTGVALLLRHETPSQGPNDAPVPPTAAEVGPGPGLDDLVERTVSQYLDPLAFSGLT